MRFFLAALICMPVLGADWNPRAAADYLDGRQKQWLAWPIANVDGGKCVSCHTGMTYMLARPALRKVLGESGPTEYETAIVGSLRTRVAKKTAKDLYPKATEPHLSEQAAVEAIFAAWFVGSPDAMERMWSLRNPEGEWAWNSFDLDPWETPESAYYGATLAVVALEGGPRDPRAAALRQRLGARYTAQPMHNRLMAMWAKIPTEAERKATLEELWGKQSADGGWTLDAMGPWAKHEKAAPSTGSNAYATAYTVVALQKAGVSDKRMARAMDWLRSHQDPQGYWDAASMNKVYPAESMMAGFMRDAATAYAAMALAGK